MRVSALVGALAVALAIAVGAAGCGEESEPAVRSIALVSPGRDNDPDWSRHARYAVEQISDERRLAGLIAEDVTAERIPDAFAQLADEGADLVFADDPSYARAAARAAEETGVPTLVWGDSGAVKPGLVGDVEIAAPEAGFLAGVLTAHATGIKSVAVLIADDGTEWDMRNWNMMAAGYIFGARHEVPDVEIEVRWVGGSDGTTHDEMRRTAEELIDRGVQTLFTLGGRSVLGVMPALDKARGEQVYAGAIGDKATIDTEDVITSVLYDFEGLYRRAIADVRDGTFGEEPYELTFENGGLRLLTTGRTPSDAYDAAMAAEPRIADETIEVPRRVTRAEVLGLLHFTEPQ